MKKVYCIVFVMLTMLIFSSCSNKNIDIQKNENSNIETMEAIGNLVQNKYIPHEIIDSHLHYFNFVSETDGFDKLIKKMENIISEIANEDFKIKLGTIASGDIFCTKSEMREKIHSKFSADAIEMEGAAIAQVCKLDNIPFIVIRSISDKPNGKNEITFEEYLKIASIRCKKIIEKFFAL